MDKPSGNEKTNRPSSGGKITLIKTQDGKKILNIYGISNTRIDPNTGEAFSNPSSHRTFNAATMSSSCFKQSSKKTSSTKKVSFLD